MFAFLCVSLTFFSIQNATAVLDVFSSYKLDDVGTASSASAAEDSAGRFCHFLAVFLLLFFHFLLFFCSIVLVFIDFVRVPVASVSGSQYLDVSVPMSVHDGVDTAYFAKYLTSPGLLQLQLADGNFRRQVKKSLFYKQTVVNCVDQSQALENKYAATDS